MTKKNKITHRQKEQTTKASQQKLIHQQKLPIFPATIFFAMARVGWKIFGIAAVVVGFLAILYPKISVSPATSLDMKNPLLTPFIISNDGNIPINNVRFKLGVQKISWKDGKKITLEPNFSSHFLNPNDTVSELLPAEKYSVLSPLTLEGKDVVEFADIAIIVEFKPFILPIKMTRTFRFITTKSSDNKLYWYPQPVSKTTTELSRSYEK
jgi:hypothetical protein